MCAERQVTAITGYGVFSCFGRGADALHDHVFQGRADFTEVTRFDTSGRRAHHAAQAPGSPRLDDVLRDAAHDALAMAGSPATDGMAVLLGTQGDWSGLTAFWRGEATSAAVEAIAGTHADVLADELETGRSRRLVFTNGCIASSSAIAVGGQLIASGKADLVLAGGGYLVDEEFFAKFDSGRALSTDQAMRPFSADRSGLLLGDGVALLVLEPLEEAQRRGCRPLAILAGSGLSADSHHVCRPHPDGAGLAKAMTSAIAAAGCTAADIGYVNCHGTATVANDVAEVRALRAVFGERLPPVSSTKGCTGHALEGSGALEAVICLLALRSGALPPTAGFTSGDPLCAVDCIANVPLVRSVRAVLSCSSAFGGANAALVLAGQS